MDESSDQNLQGSAATDERAARVDDLVLRLPGVDESAEFMRAHRTVSPAEPSFLHLFREGMTLAEYLPVLERLRNSGHLPPGFVPETFLFAFVGSRIVGRVAIRHALTPSLEREGGHIGYLVVPEFRRRGYATRMLARSLRIAHDELGIPDVLLTCADGNVGSIRVIERNGGILQDVIEVEHRPERFRRYWIHVNPLA